MCDGRGILDVAFNLPMNINEQYYVWFYYFPLYCLLSNVKLNFFQCNFELGYICFEEEKQVTDGLWEYWKMFFIFSFLLSDLIPERKMRPKNKLKDFFSFIFATHLTCSSAQLMIIFTLYSHIIRITKMYILIILFSLFAFQ